MTAQDQNVLKVASGDEVEKIREAMKAYKYFDDTTAMLAAINKAAKDSDGFVGVPTFFQGIAQDDDGSYVLTDSGADQYIDSRPTFAYVGGQKKIAGGKSEPIIKAILAFGIPTVEAVLEGAPDLLAKIIGKEMRHVYFRNYRDAVSEAALNAGFEASPVGIEAFAASAERGSAEEIDTDTFDAVWPGFRKALVEQNPKLANVLPAKGEVLKAIRSKSYADGVYPDLEKRGLFMSLAANMFTIAANQDEPLENDTIKGWVQNRASVDIAYKVTTEDDLAALDMFDPEASAAALGL